MAAVLTATGNRLTGDPSVLRRHWRDGQPVYRAGRIPDGLVTARQLRALGLSRAGLEPAGWLHYCAYHYLCPLYEIAAARPVRPLTESQRRALAAGRALANTAPCKRCGQVRVSVWGNRLCADCAPAAEAEWYAERERQQRDADEALARQIAADQAAAAKWAAGFLADPSAVVLDTETTGLGEAWIVEIAVIDATGRVLLDTLVNPQIPIPADATAIHSITDDMVAAAPAFSAILPDLARVLHGRRTGIYNQEFDCGILRGELDRHFRDAEREAAPEPWLTHPSATVWMNNLRTNCAMEWYAQWYGEWHDYWGDYTWQPLGGGHRARGDCEATLRLLHAMAAGATSSVQRHAAGPADLGRR